MIFIAFIIIVIIIITTILVFLYKSNNDNEFNTYTIDNMEVVKREKEYEKYINTLIDEKKAYYSPEELKSLKNKFQIFLTKHGIKNITFDFLNRDEKKDIHNKIEITENINNNPTKNVILKKFDEKLDFDCEDLKVLENEQYLKNYYYDMYGNKIKSNLKDYFVAYQTLIDNKDANNKCFKVDVLKGESGFIIPDQYPTLKYETNAYNIDWSRIINPLTYY